MTALTPAERSRLYAFLGKCFEPMPDQTHTGVARALLGSRYRFERDDLLLLRRMVNARTSAPQEWGRLLDLITVVRDAPRTEPELWL